jgi:sugar phosphate isomerase/epimerase
MKRGIRGHDVLAKGLSNISDRMRSLGIEYIQLVLEKSIDGFGYGQYTREYAEKIKDELSGTKIAVLGSYINPSNPDSERLAYDIERFKEKIAYAKTLCPTVVGTETGRYIEGKTHTEEAYQYLLKTVRELVREGERAGVFIGIEGVHLFVIDTPQIMKRLIDDVGSPNLKVIFDPVNLINAENYTRQNEIICDTFDLLNDRLVCVHIKDFTVVDGNIRTAPVGTGLLNYPLIFEKMREYGLDLPLITEDIDDERSVEVLNGFEAMV